MLLPLLSFTACWPGWSEIVTPSPSTEHVIEDLRVLSIAVEPAGLVVPPTVLPPVDVFGGTGEVHTLVVRPAIFDPRPGVVQASISLATFPDASTFGGGVFDVGATGLTTVPGVPEQRFDVTAPGRAAAPTSAVEPIEARFDLDDAFFRTIFAGDGVGGRGFLPVRLAAVVTVRREIDFRVETETAFVAVDVRVDPDTTRWTLDPITRASLLLDVGAVDCDPDVREDCGVPVDGPGRPDDPIFNCGNGVVDEGETCDPPDGISCPFNCGAACGNGARDDGEECDPLLDEGCQQNCTPDPCHGGESALPPVCIQWPIEPNVRPSVRGFTIDRGFGEEPDVPDVEVGGTVQVDARGSIVVQVLTDDDANATGQAFEPMFFSETCVVPSAQCFDTGVFAHYAFYVQDDGSRIAQAGIPEDEQQFFPVNSGNVGGVVFRPREGAQPGETTTLIALYDDGQGGLDTASLTIEVR